MQAFWHWIPIPDSTFPTEFRSKQIHNFPSFSRFEFSFYKFLTRTCILHSKFMCYNHMMQHNNSVYSLVWRWNCWAISDIKKNLANLLTVRSSSKYIQKSNIFSRWFLCNFIENADKCYLRLDSCIVIGSLSRKLHTCSIEYFQLYQHWIFPTTCI